MELNSPILGFRSWRYSTDNLLAVTLISKAVPWNPGINKATCYATLRQVRENTATPHTNHHCGFNAFFSLDDAEMYHQQRSEDVSIVGAIAGAGKIQFHHKGFRAAEAQVLALFAETSKKALRLQRISKTYNVPIFQNKQEFLDFVSSCVQSIDSFRIPKENTKAYRDSWRGLVFPVDSINNQPSLELGNKKFWYRNERLHRDGDLPAIEVKNGNRWVERSPQLIHEFAPKIPKIIYAEEVLEWYKYGKLHRDGDAPAKIIFSESNQMEMASWYKNGEIHRDGDKPASIFIEKHFDGERRVEEWWKEGTLYRTEENFEH